MKEILQAIVDYLKYNTSYTKEQMIMIINPLKTENQAQMFMKWLKIQPPMIWYDMRVKAKEIAQEN